MMRAAGGILTAARRGMKLAAMLGAGLALGGCSSITGDSSLDLFGSSKPEAALAAPEGQAIVQSDLEKATDYWGKAYAKAPQNPKTALAYARNLKALGRKSEAFQILQTAAQLNNSDKELAGEYGRLALELDQTTLASQLLEYADDPVRPDWRIMSARGASLAKLGKYKDAIVHLERAQKLAPQQASVLNNLALAYAMSGDAPRAETVLRDAVSKDATNAKTRQNLALVLGLQGKYDEATQVGSTAVAADVAKENTALLRQIVKLDPKQAPVAVPQAATAIAATPASVAPGTAPVAPAVAGWSSVITAN